MVAITVKLLKKVSKVFVIFFIKQNLSKKRGFLISKCTVQDLNLRPFA